LADLAGESFELLLEQSGGRIGATAEQGNARNGDQGEHQRNDQPDGVHGVRIVTYRRPKTKYPRLDLHPAVP
jgi:hypothetical protein